MRRVRLVTRQDKLQFELVIEGLSKDSWVGNLSPQKVKDAARMSLNRSISDYRHFFLPAHTLSAHHSGCA